MRLFPFWTNFFIIFLHFMVAPATIWNVSICFHRKLNFVAVSLDNVKYVNVTSEKESKCFNTEFELDDATKPSFVEFEIDEAKYQTNPYYVVNVVYKAIVQDPDLQQMYLGICGMTFCKETMISLEKMERWTFEVTRSDINNDTRAFFYIFHAEYINVRFSRNSRILNSTFFLPTEWSRTPRIPLLSNGTFGLDTTVKLQNMETFKTYSCIFISYPHTSERPHHECFLINDSTWKIGLTYESKLKENFENMIKFVGVNGREENSSSILKFEKLAYLPLISSFISIPKENLSEVQLEFDRTGKPSFHISKIVLTRMLSGEEYGCIHIKRKDPWRYSCKVQKGKNWLLKVISPEEQERIFSVEIIQDTLSSFTRRLEWNSFCTYGDRYVKYFNLKTYEDKGITNINLHFQNKSLRINEISLISNYSEYKFKRNEESNAQNSSVAGFSRITKEEINPYETIPVMKTEEINPNETTPVTKTDKIDCNKTILIMKIVIGLLTISILLSLIFITRYLILRRNTSKHCISRRCHVTAEDNKCCSMQNTNSTHINKPGQALCFQKQNSEDCYEHRDSNPLITASPEDGSVSYVAQ